MQESSTYPHTLAQWIYVALAGVIVYGGGLITAWFRRKREPAEVAKINAETRSVQIATEISPVGITLETLREIQSVIEKAEVRREAWLLKEEQLRGQIMFWRNKAEELDGDVIGLQEQNDQHETRAKLHEHQIRKLKALLDYHSISYAELDQQSR